MRRAGRRSGGPDRSRRRPGPPGVRNRPPGQHGRRRQRWPSPAGAFAAGVDILARPVPGAGLPQVEEDVDSLLAGRIELEGHLQVADGLLVGDRPQGLAGRPAQVVDGLGRPHVGRPGEVAGQLGKHRSPVGLVGGLVRLRQLAVQLGSGRRGHAGLDRVVNDGVGELVGGTDPPTSMSSLASTSSSSPPPTSLAGRSSAWLSTRSSTLWPATEASSTTRRAWSDSRVSRSATTSRTLSGTPAWAAERTTQRPPTDRRRRSIQVAPQLAEVEGVAPAVTGQHGGQGAQVGVEIVADLVGQEPLHRRLVEAREAEPAGGVGPAQVGQAAGQRLGDLVAGVPEGGDHEQVRGRSRPGQVTQQRHRGGAGPVQVVDHHPVGRRPAASARTASTALNRR